MTDVREADLWDLGHVPYSELNKSYLGNHGYLLAFLREHGFDTDSWEVFFAGISTRVGKRGGRDGVRRWHRDMADYHNGASPKSKPDKHYYLAMWCESHPTELRKVRRPQIYVLDTQHFYLMDNNAWLHRQPANIPPRKFYRAIIEVKDDQATDS